MSEAHTVQGLIASTGSTPSIMALLCNISLPKCPSPLTCCHLLFSRKIFPLPWYPWQECTQYKSKILRGCAEQGIGAFQERMNANGSASSSSGGDVGLRMRKALEYKRRASNGKLPAAAGPGSSAGQREAPAAPNLSNGAVSNGAVPPAAVVRAVADASGPVENGAAADAKIGDLAEKMARLPATAPARVRSAMSAAMQYRQQKAAAAAKAAAEQALHKRAPSSRQSPSSNGST